MNAEHTALVENNIGIVGACMKRLKIRDEDLFQDACLQLCRCAEKFSPALNVKFSTYAFRCVYLFLLRQILAKHEYERKFSPVPIEQLNLQTDDTTALFCDVKGLLQCLSEKEQELVMLRIKGMTYREIAMKIGKSRAYVGNYFKDIQYKMLVFLDD